MNLDGLKHTLHLDQFTTHDAVMVGVGFVGFAIIFFAFKSAKFTLKLILLLIAASSIAATWWHFHK